MSLSEQLADLCKIDDISELRARINKLQIQLGAYGYWTSLDGAEVDIRSMTNPHLINSLKACTRMDEAYEWNTDKQRQFAELIIEAHRRNLPVMQWLA